MRSVASVAVLIALVVSTKAAPAQTKNTVFSAVVFYGTPPAQGYGVDVLREMRQFAQRADGYQPRPRPVNIGSEMRMVYSAREGYERKLVAAAGSAGVERLAQQYVDDLRPCYEWEGFHDCPEREARFAEKYLVTNPTSPFREFLQLLVAHRWICTAEGYEREEVPQEAARARRSAESPLAAALRSPALLIRTAAQELETLGRCDA